MFEREEFDNIVANIVSMLGLQGEDGNTSYHSSSQSGDTVLALQNQESDEEKSESKVDVADNLNYVPLLVETSFPTPDSARTYSDSEYLHKTGDEMNKSVFVLNLIKSKVTQQQNEIKDATIIFQ